MVSEKNGPTFSHENVRDVEVVRIGKSPSAV